MDCSAVRKDREPSDTVYAHHLCCLVEPGLGVNGLEIARHDVGFGLSLRAVSFGEDPHCEVPIGYDSDRTLVFSDDDASDLLVAHHLGEFRYDEVSALARTTSSLARS